MHKLRSLFKKRERASKSTSPNPSGSHIGLTNLPPKPNGQSLPPPNKLAAIPLSTDTAAEGGRCEVSCYSYSIKNINMENSTKLLLNSIKDKLVLEIELSSKLRRLLQIAEVLKGYFSFVAISKRCSMLMSKQREVLRSGQASCVIWVKLLQCKQNCESETRYRQLINRYKNVLVPLPAPTPHRRGAPPAW
ncbi:hypothetical protein J6590_009618 [Homalodisca vitripennis]|nr:hypothetical protein J6590_009618 [Homalodisca vitripennis]